MANDLLATKSHDKKLYGRKWKVSVLVPLVSTEISADVNKYTAYVLSNSDYEDQSLKASFRIEKLGWTTPNFSEITVYNVNTRDEVKFVQMGVRILVEAGYKDGDYGVIYDGSVYQALWEREDLVNIKLVFRCIDAMDLLYENHVEAWANALRWQKDAVVSMMKESRKPFGVEISEGMGDTQLARGKIFFGNPMHYVRKYAQQYGTVVSAIDRKVYIHRPQDPIPEDLNEKALVISPEEGGIIDIPQQTQDGVTLTCLLNPRIKVFGPNAMMIKIDKKMIKQMRLQYGSPGFSRLDENGIYRVLGVVHTGDTRGRDWYTTATLCNQIMEGTLAAMFNTKYDVIK